MHNLRVGYGLAGASGLSTGYLPDCPAGFSRVCTGGRRRSSYRVAAVLDGEDRFAAGARRADGGGAVGQRDGGVDRDHHVALGDPVQ